MKRTQSKSRWICLATALAVALLAGGCEDAETHMAITLTPDEVELTETGSVLFTAELANVDPEATDDRAEELLQPLVWRVQNPGLGAIQSSGGNSAVYQSNGLHVQNVVHVRDQGGREGVAVVNQR